VDAYYKAFRTTCDKPVQEFVVSGDHAFGRYSYTATDTPLGGGKAMVDTGWGLVVYHRDTDGVASGIDCSPAREYQYGEPRAAMRVAGSALAHHIHCVGGCSSSGR